jgi:hypothetical protein
MALRTPPSWLQNASHPAENDRLSNQALYATTGVIGLTSLEVTQSVVPAMSVSIAAGWAAIVGNYTANQGVYMAYNDAALTATITTADPTNPRIDRVCITVNDSAYTGSLNNVVVNVVAGTPAGSPVAPATPTNSISLATIAVGAGVTTILTANITDTRVQVTTNLQIGDITAVTAGTGISGGGTSGAVTITNSMATAITTSGDLIQGTGSGTFARLGSGTNGQYLTTNGTTLSWVTPTAGATINYLAFTSSQTWTVPATAQYVDVFVVGGGVGGTGGIRSTAAANNGGTGGAITMVRDIYLGGTGTVSIVVGAGTAGTAGNATTTQTYPSSAGYSGFGTYCYSGGGFGASSDTGGVPGYKGTVEFTSTQYAIGRDTTNSNWAPAMTGTSTFPNFYTTTGTLAQSGLTQGINANGYYGGSGGAPSSTLLRVRAGAHPGNGVPGTVAADITTNTIPQAIPSTYLTAIGAATAGTAGQGSTGAGGAAGIAGFGGGGGTCIPTVNANGGQGGPGAGGGGSFPATLGLNGGNGGNAGTNTGAGGGNGANTGSASAGTGGNGGNGAAGIVIVKWLS